MKATLTRWAGWFTDQKRQAVQALVASTVSLLVIVGAVSDVQSSALLDLSASGLLAVQGALGLFLLRAGDRYTWLNTNGRGVIYALGGAIGAAGFAFSLWSDSTAGLIVQVATVLASILVGAVQMVNAGTLNGWPDGGPVDEDRLATVAESRAAEQAAAARSIEASPATFAREKDPDPLAGHWSNGDPVHVITDGETRRVAPNRNGATWIAEPAEAAPNQGLTVGVFDPIVRPAGFYRSRRAEVEQALAPDVVGSVTVLHVPDEARGLSFDVVFSAVPLTRAEAEVFVPCIAGSAYAGRRIASLP